MITVNCTILTQDLELCATLADQLARMPEVALVRAPERNRSIDQLVRFLDAGSVRIVLLDIRTPDALKISGEMELHDPGMQFIALGEPSDPETPWLGINERLGLPLDAAALEAAVRRRLRVLEKLPQNARRRGSFFSFLPAKAGAGTTTLACGLADISATRDKTLLCDFDLVGGTVSFRYRMDKPHSLPEVFDSFDRVDQEMWEQVYSECGPLNVLPSSPRLGVRLRVDVFPKWFDLLRSTYDTVIFDLSGYMEDFAFDLMEASDQVFVVTTQELECLHLGRSKAEALRRSDLAEKSSVLVNRFQKAHTLKNPEIVDLLGLPVKWQFPNDYKTVQDSIHDARPMKENATLSRALSGFHEALKGAKRQAPKAHKFLEFVKLPALNYWRRAEMRDERWA